MTATYKKRKFFKKPRMLIYVDGPFCAEGTKKEKAKKICSDVYENMVKRSLNSDCEYIRYEKI